VADDNAVRMTGSAGATLSKLFGIESFRSDGNCYGFSMGFHSAMFLRQEFWADFTLLPDVEGKAFVSAAVYKAMVLHDNAHVLDFAQALVERSVDAFFLAGAPIREAMIQRQAACASRPEMLAIQARYLSTMAAAFRSAGVRFVPAPPTAMSGGVLLSMYDSLLEDDVHHGNPKFAALQWELIAEELLPRERAA